MIIIMLTEKKLRNIIFSLHESLTKTKRQNKAENLQYFLLISFEQSSQTQSQLNYSTANINNETGNTIKMKKYE